MRRVLIALVLATLAGCGGDEPEPGAEHASASAAATPAEYPVAWAVDRGDLAKLAEKRLPDAVEGAEVVARTSWDPYLMIVLGEWLHEQGVDLDHPRVAAADAIGEAWEAPVLVLTAEHAERYGRKLDRLQPDREELRAFADEFTDEPSPDSGDAMAAWLEVAKRSVAATAGDRVVVIPIPG